MIVAVVYGSECVTPSTTTVQLPADSPVSLNVTVNVYSVNVTATVLGFAPATAVVPCAGLGPKNSPPDWITHVYVPFGTVSVRLVAVPVAVHVTPV